MAKFYNNRVKTGKLAGSVFAIRYGETIERAYQPIVANPSTSKQVESRAKLKMLSQLSAVLAPTIAIPRQGAVSKRNLFTKINYPVAQFSNGESTIEMPQVQLTRSSVALPGVQATRTADGLSVAVGGATNIDRMVYVVVVKGNDNKLRLQETAVVDTPGANFTYPTTLEGVTGQVFVLGYGVRDNTDAARAAFGNLISPDAETVAKIITSRTLLESDVTLTETRGFSLPAGQ